MITAAVSTMTAVSRVTSQRCHSGAEWAAYVRVGVVGA